MIILITASLSFKHKKRWSLAGNVCVGWYVTEVFNEPVDFLSFDTTFLLPFSHQVSVRNGFQLINDCVLYIQSENTFHPKTGIWWNGFCLGTALRHGCLFLTWPRNLQNTLHLRICIVPSWRGFWVCHLQQNHLEMIRACNHWLCFVTSQFCRLCSVWRIVNLTSFLLHALDHFVTDLLNNLTVHNRSDRPMRGKEKNLNTIWEHTSHNFWTVSSSSFMNW